MRYLRRLFWTMGILLVSIAMLVGAASAKAKPKQGSLVLGERRAYRQYIFRSYGHYGELGGYFEILKNGKRIYTRSGGNFMVDQAQGSVKPLFGTDITGDGKPDLVVSEFGRGAHGPYFTYVFEIGSRFRHIATIAGENDSVRFSDLDKDGRLEALLEDWTFAYWNASFAGSPAPDVILRYKNGNYVPATDLMRKPLPSSEKIEKAAQVSAEGLMRIANYPNDDPSVEPPSQLWEMMLDLIYTGHANDAWKFFEHAWPAGVSGKQQFLTDFRKQLSRSPYWPAIKDMNGTALVAAKRASANGFPRRSLLTLPSPIQNS